MQMNAVREKISGMFEPLFEVFRGKHTVKEQTRGTLWTDRVVKCGTEVNAQGNTLEEAGELVKSERVCADL